MFPCFAGLAWYLFWQKWPPSKKFFFQPPSAHIGPILGVSIPVLDQTVKGSWFNSFIHIFPFILFKNGYFWFSHHNFLCFPVLLGWPGTYFGKNRLLKKKKFPASISSHRTNFRGQHTCIRPESERKLI